MKKSLKILGTLFFTVMIFSGCSKSFSSGTEKSSDTHIADSEKSENKTITITDSENEDVEVPVNPKKVIVFDIGALDTIDSLGKETDVIAVPTESLPKYLNKYADLESAGGIKEPDIEKINQMQPDLIIISGRQQEFKAELANIAPTLYLSVDYTDTWESTKQNIQTLAMIFSEDKKADTEIAGLETKIEEVKQKAEDSQLKALATLVNEGQLSVYGSGSRFGIIHDTFGFEPADSEIEASTHGQSASYEYILEKNPDIIFVIDRTKAIGGDASNNDVANNELAAQTNAGKNNKIISLAADVWYLSGGGIQSTSLMLEDVANVFK
ncbi:siderophore ABC transporter substrate-binding protein [Vagococcus elongatus]|uniref:Iron ABC transporter substrate-binding protein n=1 Tax=Vagococcus elongatus TaxID=180344 RepID=A0A430B5N8_9ENTE|nr:siderophore ABC transporter substrate-binding protein [Vagococcus elongatus]RSU15622.1 iron ABC transporter substrate-binding protein [Vagococcus elongatus]